MDYQEKSNLKIGVSGVGKKYLKIPWSIEDTIENLTELKEALQKRVIVVNLHGRGKMDAEEIAFDFNRAIQALKENQEYRKLGTLEEVRETVEKQKAKKISTHVNDSDIKIGNVVFRKGTKAHKCQCDRLVMRGYKFCPECGQRIDWSEVE